VPHCSSSTRRSSPTCTQRRLLPPASSAAPTSALPVLDVHLRPRHCGPPRRGGPPRHAAPASPPLLGGDRPPALLSSVATPPLLGGDLASALLLSGGLLQPVCRAADASACRPPLRSPAGVRVPDGRPGAGGFALLTSAREMLASARIYN
jgi:hypothetical protein